MPLQERLKAGIPTLGALFPEAGPSMPLQELFYLTDFFDKVVFKISIPAQIRQLILYHYSCEE